MGLIIDAHLDLAWNAVSFDRDQLLSVDQLRALEAHMTGKSRGNCTVSLPELRRGGIAVCLATVLARAMPSPETWSEGTAQKTLNHPNIGSRRRGETILRENLDFANQTIASAAAQAQLVYYQLLEQQGHLRMIRCASQLDELWSSWQHVSNDREPIGFILSMEGTDPIVDPDHASWWWDQGLRTACLAHYGPSAHAMGTGGDGPLTEAGTQLLKAFNRLGVVLDLVHTADTAFFQALDRYDGPVYVSHGNCRTLVPHDRQISDEQIRLIVQRGGVIGVVFDCWMLKPDWFKSDRGNNDVTLETVADHIDHVCQLAGNARHVGIGSDLDGGFGREQSPNNLDTIADLQKIGPILQSRGYSDQDVDAILHGNWLTFWRGALP